jgi:hypothetical protein
MAGAELAFEVLSGALESVHGTPIAAPTHIFNLLGMITPQNTISRRTQSDGTLSEFRRSAVTRNLATWEGTGDLDVNTLPFLLEMAIKGAGVITTPGGGTTSRNHTYTPTMTSDDLKSATIYWGDPNTQILQSAYSMIDTITISSDTSNTESSTVSVKGTCQFPSKVSAPTQPAMTTPGLIVGQKLSMSIDTTLAISTTAVTGRVISAEHTISSGVTYKYLAGGPTSNLTYTRHGRKKRHMETKITMELTDFGQYDIFAAGTVAKVRTVHNGPVIEGSIYNSVTVDCYGPLSDLTWTDLEGSNRAVSFTIQSEYDTTLAADFRVIVTNAVATI